MARRGGSYVIDPETGEPVLRERTEQAAVVTAAEPEEQPTSEVTPDEDA